MVEILNPKLPSKLNAGTVKKTAKSVGDVAWGAALVAGGIGVYALFLRPLAAKIPVVGSVWSTGATGQMRTNSFGMPVVS